MLPRLKKKYNEEIAPKMLKEFGYKSIMQVPRITKIVVNKGIGSAVADKKVLDEGVEELSIITGQKAIPTVAKISISNFKLREGMKIGAKSTLHNDKMYEFLDRLINIALPRVRDFNGLGDKSFDGRGNYSLGIKEQIIFPEISIDKVRKISGLEITIVTDTNSDKEAFSLLKCFGMPFKK